MFTGIIETRGYIKTINSYPGGISCDIHSSLDLSTSKIGDSIAVNGVCLSITHKKENIFSVDIVKETLDCTHLARLKIGESINLERALLANGRIGGHFVQGHIDSTCQFLGFSHENKETRGHFSIPPQLAPYIVKKGFIALDGMSLTVASCHETQFSIAFIPHTLQQTIAGDYQPGQAINLEVDILAKYVENLRVLKIPL